MWQTICDILHIRGSVGPDFGDTVPSCEEIETDILNEEIEQELEYALEYWEYIHDYDY